MTEPADTPALPPRLAPIPTVDELLESAKFWHEKYEVAEKALAAARQERDDFYMHFRQEYDAEAKATLIRMEQLEAQLAAARQELTKAHDKLSDIGDYEAVERALLDLLKRAKAAEAQLAAVTRDLETAQQENAIVRRALG